MTLGLDGRGGHEPRLRGFKKRLAAAGISLPDQMVRIAETNVESGRQAFQEVLRAPKLPSALFAGNDLMALGAMEFALDNSLRVPEDISIVGIDDIDLSRHVRPALTTIALPKRNLAEKAVELLVDKLTTAGEKPNVSILQPFLVRRQSTCHFSVGKRKSQ
jgi:DNA-binding LacI/PurR family transcriptional regulator